jgi:hypothetical protein
MSALQDYAGDLNDYAASRQQDLLERPGRGDGLAEFVERFAQNLALSLQRLGAGLRQLRPLPVGQFGLWLIRFHQSPRRIASSCRAIHPESDRPSASACFSAHRLSAGLTRTHIWASLVVVFFFLVKPAIPFLCQYFLDWKSVTAAESHVPCRPHRRGDEHRVTPGHRIQIEGTANLPCP